MRSHFYHATSKQKYSNRRKENVHGINFGINIAKVCRRNTGRTKPDENMAFSKPF